MISEISVSRVTCCVSVPAGQRVVSGELDVFGQDPELLCPLRADPVAAEPATASFGVRAVGCVAARPFQSADRREQVEIIKLYGSMELAPLVGLSDLIVDVVDTGNTLKANGLRPLEKITDISSRLVVNKASMKRKHARVQSFIDRVAEAVREQEEVA